MNKKLKSVLNIVLDVVIVLFMVFAAFVLVVSLSQKVEDPNSGKLSHVFGYSFRNIQSESMEAYNEDGEPAKGAFFKGDIVIFKLTSRDSYEVGETVLFRMPVDAGENECDPNSARNFKFVAHNIVEVVTTEDGRTLYRTQGLSEKDYDPDLNLKDASEILAVYTGVRLAGFGGFTDFVKSGTGFFLCIILPIAIFVVIQTIRVIRNLVAYKAQKASLAAASGELTEEQKRQIAEEYLKQQLAAENNTAPSTDKIPADEEPSVEEENPAEEDTSSAEESTADDE